LHYLHQNGVVHGDLTPANILVNDSHSACLVDFGLSTVVDEDGPAGPMLSSTNPPGGAARRFQAPELDDPDIECVRNTMSDVFSLGMVYYQVQCALYMQFYLRAYGHVL
jgi:serine/threonine protein kinase